MLAAAAGKVASLFQLASGADSDIAETTASGEAGAFSSAATDAVAMDDDASSEASGEEPQTVTKKLVDAVAMDHDASSEASGEEPQTVTKNPVDGGASRDHILVIGEETKKEKKQIKKWKKKEKKHRKAKGLPAFLRDARCNNKGTVLIGDVVIDESDSMDVSTPPSASPPMVDASLVASKNAVDGVVECAAKAHVDSAVADGAAEVSGVGPSSAASTANASTLHDTNTDARQIAVGSGMVVDASTANDTNTEVLPPSSDVDSSSARTVAVGSAMVIDAGSKKPTLPSTVDESLAANCASTEALSSSTGAGSSSGAPQMTAIDRSTLVNAGSRDAEHAGNSKVLAHEELLTVERRLADTGECAQEVARDKFNATDVAAQETVASASRATKKVDAKGDSRRLDVSTLWSEDVYEHGHNSVWGSCYDAESRQWGYGCCRSTDRTTACSNPSTSAPSKKRKERSSAKCLAYDWSNAPTSLVPRHKIMLTAELISGDTGAIAKQGAFLAHFIRFATGAWRRMLEGGKIWSDDGKHMSKIENIPQDLRGMKALEDTQAGILPLLQQLESNQADAATLKQLDILVSLAADREYSEAGKAYLEMTMGRKKWNNTLASYAGTHCQNKGFRIYITKQDVPLKFDTDPATQKIMQSVRRLVNFMEVIRPPADAAKRNSSIA